MVTNDRIVLLFCHGSSYTKEVWQPITRRLEKSPLLQRVPVEIVAFDWLFHGENFDHSEAGELHLRDGLKHSRRVQHPAKHWPQSSQETLAEKIKEIRVAGGDRNTRIVAIGHSMGASALLQYEITHPGTFDGFIGFEPIYESGVLTDEQTEGARDMLVAVSLARESEWPTRELAEEHLKSSKAFRRWHSEALDAYLASALIEADGVFKLAMTPMQEAAAFCHEFLQFTPETLARAQCPLFLEQSERSFFFFPQSANALAEKLGGKLVVGAPVPKTTHTLVHEDPDACTQRILEDLAQLPLFH